MRKAVVRRLMAEVKKLGKAGAIDLTGEVLLHIGTDHRIVIIRQIVVVGDQSAGVSVLLNGSAERILPQI